jgi:four helix bundle protein
MDAAEEGYKLAVKIVFLAKDLEKRRCYAIANQLIRSGTSVGANLNEAKSPESRKDFIHKMKIAQKEAHETTYWLRLIKDTENIDTSELISKLWIIMKIISKSIHTAKQNLRGPTEEKPF